jgi:hypothetical protein
LKPSKKHFNPKVEEAREMQKNSTTILGSSTRTQGINVCLGTSTLRNEVNGCLITENQVIMNASLCGTKMDREVLRKG